MHQTYYKSKNNFTIKPETIDSRKRNPTDFRIGKIIGKGNFLLISKY